MIHILFLVTVLPASALLKTLLAPLMRRRIAAPLLQPAFGRMNRNPAWLARHTSRIFPRSCPTPRHQRGDGIDVGYDQRPASRARRIILHSNGTKTRHHVIDPQTGDPGHTNAQLTARAIRGLANGHFRLKDTDLIAWGTTAAGQRVPSHAGMVHETRRTAVARPIAEPPDWV